MKIVFRGYTDKKGMPIEEGYYKILQYLNGNTQKNIIVRMDYDKKKVYGLDEDDFFFPSLKISKLDVKKIDDSTLEAEFKTKDLRNVFTLFVELAGHGNCGHGFSVSIGNKDFYIDGDGSDYIKSINGIEIKGKLFDDRSKWPEIYNKGIKDNDMNNNEIKIKANELQDALASAVKNVLKENNIISESFASPKLARLAKEHGGISVGRNGGLRDGVKAFHIKNPYSSVAISTVTDDMLEGEPYDYDSVKDMSSDKFNNAIVFNDGWAIGIKKDAAITPANRGERLVKRSGSGIGDTGDHDKNRGGFVGNGKDALSAPYNAYSVSDDAGYSQTLRQAHDFNKSIGDKATVFDINNRGRELVRQHYRMNESELKTLISNSIRKAINEITDYGCNLFGSANLNPTTKDKYGVDYDEYLTIHNLIYDIVDKFGDYGDAIQNYTNRSTTAYFYGKIEDRPEMFEKIKQYCLENGYETTMEDSIGYSGMNKYDVVKVTFKKVNEPTLNESKVPANEVSEEEFYSVLKNNGVQLDMDSVNEKISDLIADAQFEKGEAWSDREGQYVDPDYAYIDTTEPLNSDGSLTLTLKCQVYGELYTEEQTHDYPGYSEVTYNDIVIDTATICYGNVCLNIENKVEELFNDEFKGCTI